MRRACAIAVLTAVLACGGAEDEARIRVPAPSASAETSAEAVVAVREVRLGSAIEEGGGITRETAEFGPGDTVFMSAVLEGTVGQANLTVRWSRPEGGSVGEEERFVSLDGRRIVVFRLAPPAGLAPGRYVVELLLGGQPAGRKEFTVRG